MQSGLSLLQCHEKLIEHKESSIEKRENAMHQLLIDVAVSDVSQDTKESITTEIDSQINYERENIKQLKDEKADLMDRRDALLDDMGQDRDVCDKDKTPQAKNSGAKRKLGSTS